MLTIQIPVCSLFVGCRPIIICVLTNETFEAVAFSQNILQSFSELSGYVMRPSLILSGLIFKISIKNFT